MCTPNKIHTIANEPFWLDGLKNENNDEETATQIKAERRKMLDWNPMCVKHKKQNCGKLHHKYHSPSLHKISCFVCKTPPPPPPHLISFLFASTAPLFHRFETQKQPHARAVRFYVTYKVCALKKPNDRPRAFAHVIQSIRTTETRMYTIFHFQFQSKSPHTRTWTLYIINILCTRPSINNKCDFVPVLLRSGGK